MIYILHLETSTKVCSVALSLNGKMIALKETEEDGYSHGENLTLFIQDVLIQADISLKDLKAISVASGPGSYTGLRIGTSTAKGLCYPLNIPLIAIDSLTCLKEIALEKHTNTTLCSLIDARRMEVYNLFYSSSNELVKPISADIIEFNSYQEFEPFVYFGDGAEKLKELWNTLLILLIGKISILFFSNSIDNSGICLLISKKPIISCFWLCCRLISSNFIE